MFGSSTKHVKDQSLAMRRRISTEHVQYLLRTASKQEEKNRYLASVGSPRCEIGKFRAAAKSRMVGGGRCDLGWRRRHCIRVRTRRRWLEFVGGLGGLGTGREVAAGSSSRCERAEALGSPALELLHRDRRSRSEAAAFCRWENPPNRAMDSGGLGMEKNGSSNQKYGMVGGQFQRNNVSV
jgi:hypothetical protein